MIGSETRHETGNTRKREKVPGFYPCRGGRHRPLDARRFSRGARRRGIRDAPALPATGTGASSTTGGESLVAARESFAGVKEAFVTVKESLFSRFARVSFHSRARQAVRDRGRVLCLARERFSLVF